MTEQALIDSLKQIVEPYVENKEAFGNMNADTDFIKDLEIDSATLVDVVLDVEDKFDIHIENEEMEQMLTVKASIKIIQDKLGTS